MRRWIPLLIFILLVALFYLSGMHHYFDLEIIRSHYHTLKILADNNPILSPILFTLCYIAIVALSIPDWALFSIVAGTLFPQPLATICIVVGGSIGAVCIFLMARGFLHDWLLRIEGARIQKMKVDMLADAAHYLLFLRLTPFCPFWLTNLAPALFNVPLRTFIWTTVVGVIPTSIIFTQAGAGLQSLFEIQGEVSWDLIFNYDVKLALAMMTLLALLPLAAKLVWKEKKSR